MLVSLLSLLPSAHAVIHAGNPHLDFFVTPPEGSLSSGTVDLATVTVERCGGGEDVYIVDATIDPVEGFGLTIAGGDLCAVILAWDSEMVLSGDNAAGPYTVVYDEPSTTVVLDQTAPVALDPFTVTSGVIHAGNPHLELDVGL